MNNDGIYPVEEVMGAGVTLFANVFSRKAERRMLGAVLRSFASGKYWKTVCEARAYLRDGDQEMYKACKAMLPVVAFGGVFEGGHSKGHLVRYNHIVVIDIDHLEGAALPTAVGQLREDEYVFAYWLSPSGEGLKGLVRISGDDGGRVDEYHHRAFRQLTAHFKRAYGIDIDQSGSDYSRLCYACWDEHLAIKETARVFSVEDKEEIPERAPEGGLRCQPKALEAQGKRSYSRRTDIKTVEDIIRYLRDSGRSITHDYDSWVRVAYAIAATFTPRTGLSLFLQLSRQDADKYDEEACRRMFDYCCRHTDGQVSLGTVVYLARNAGWVPSGSRRRKETGGNEGN